LGLGFGTRCGLLLPRLAVQVRQVFERQRQSGGRGDVLNRHAVQQRESCAQRLVTPDNLVQSGGERVNVELPPEAHGRRQVIREVLRVEAVEEPQALLSEGKE
jgi:hypothetical protein